MYVCKYIAVVFHCCFVYWQRDTLLDSSRVIKRKAAYCKHIFCIIITQHCSGNFKNTEGSHLEHQQSVSLTSLEWYMHHEYQKSPWGFLTFFPKWLGIFSPNFSCLLYVPINARLQIFIELPATLMKLGHIKHNHPFTLYAQIVHHLRKCTLGCRT